MRTSKRRENAKSRERTEVQVSDVKPIHSRMEALELSACFGLFVIRRRNSVSCMKFFDDQSSALLSHSILRFHHALIPLMIKLPKLCAIVGEAIAV